MSSLKACAPVLLVAILAACNDASSPDTTRDDIRGTVVDASGRPVAGAVVVLQHELDPPLGSPYGASGDKAQIMISFQQPSAGPVSVWLSSFCDEDTVRSLFTGELPAGQHAFVWDGRDASGRLLPDGVYWYHVKRDTDDRRSDFLLLHLGYGDVAAGDSVAPLAVTDAKGRFRLDQGCLPFGHTVTATDALGEPLGTLTVTHQVRVWAGWAGDDARAASDLVAVDPESGAVVEIVLGR